jgi:hypothetical protein
MPAKLRLRGAAANTTLLVLLVVGDLSACGPHEKEDHVTTILCIEHRVAGFDRWRQAFDSDPEERERSGVLRYRIMRACDDPNFVLIDLEFHERGPAETFLTRLRSLWNRVDVTHDPQARVVELIEERVLGQTTEPA